MIKDNLSIHNKFEFEVIDVRTNKVRQQAVAYNVICNGFWSRCTNRLKNTSYSGTIWNTGIAYGDGTGTPSESDTALFSNRGYKAYAGAGSVTSDDRFNGVISVRSNAVINPEEAVGVDISEIGMSENGTALLTHAMLQDMNGNTIVIHKTDTDLINIYATVYLHWNPDELFLQSDVREDGAYTYGFLWKMFGMSMGGMSSGTSSIETVLLKSGRGFYSSNDAAKFPYIHMPDSAYTTSNKKLKYTKSRMPADSGNGTGGYRYLYSNNWLAIDISKVTDPSEITEESVGTGNGVTTRFGTKFDFPYNAKVYVNGVLKSGVTVNKIPGKNFRMLGDYFDMLVGNSTQQKQVPVFYNFSLYWQPVKSYDGYLECSENYLFRNVANDVGISHMQAMRNSSRPNSQILVSDDLTNWVDITPENNNKVEVPEQYRNSRFIRLNNMKIYYPSYDGCNIEFDTPPADGDVITIDYTTDVLAKDADHVYDLEWELSFDNLLS